MQKLNQIVAVEKTIKNQTATELTAAYHLIQKMEPLKGIARVYRPKDDQGDQLPPESTPVQVRVDDVIALVTKILTRLMDVTATKDNANTLAKADLIVDGSTLLTGVPVTTLLFLEKQLVDIHAFVKKLPVLDPSERWSFSEEQNCFVTEPIGTTRTKKVMRNHVKAPATDKHPAQVEVFTEDEIVGFWSTIKYSGALPQKRVAQLLDRVEKLQLAIKFAIESANSAEAHNKSVATQIFGYLFAK